LNIPSTCCASKRKWWVFLVHAGIKTMTATTPAKGQSTPAAGMPSAIKAESLPHLLGAHNALTLASLYLEKGNVEAAKGSSCPAIADRTARGTSMSAPIKFKSIPALIGTGIAHSTLADLSTGDTVRIEAVPCSKRGVSIALWSEASSITMNFTATEARAVAAELLAAADTLTQGRAA
jgi:hypothetical protein